LLSRLAGGDMSRDRKLASPQESKLPEFDFPGVDAIVRAADRDK
jgi:hypothetical protein